MSWHVYSDPQTGFSIHYPASYKAMDLRMASDTPWLSRELVAIYNPNAQGSTEFSAPLVQVTLIRQPVNAGGAVYHMVEAFWQSGEASQVAGSATGTLISVNGMPALRYPLPRSDVSDIATDDYLLIRNDLIYDVAIDADSPYEETVVESIAWR